MPRLVNAVITYSMTDVHISCLRLLFYSKKKRLFVCRTGLTYVYMSSDWNLCMHKHMRICHYVELYGHYMLHKVSFFFFFGWEPMNTGFFDLNYKMSDYFLTLKCNTITNNTICKLIFFRLQTKRKLYWFYCDIYIYILK